MIIKYFLPNKRIKEWREARISLCPIFLYQNTRIEMRTGKAFRDLENHLRHSATKKSLCGT